MHGTNVKIIPPFVFTVDLSLACRNENGVAMTSVTALRSSVAGGHE